MATVTMGGGDGDGIMRPPIYYLHQTVWYVYIASIHPNSLRHRTSSRWVEHVKQQLHGKTVAEIAEACNQCTQNNCKTQEERDAFTDWVHEYFKNEVRL